MSVSSKAIGPLRLTCCDAVGTLSINRSSKRNSLDSETLRQLPELLSTAAADANLRVLILTGGAGCDFSAGADIDELEIISATPSAVVKFQGIFAAAQTAVESFPKPVIAMISGACVGGGCGLVLGCDVRFADTTARFGITPAKLGLAYGLADTRRLVEAVGHANAADLLFSAKLIDASEAVRVGIATRVLATECLLAETTAWAMGIAANAPSSLSTIKQILRRVRDGARDDDDASRAMFAAAFEGTAFAEGRKAFAEHRRPYFAVTHPKKETAS